MTEILDSVHVNQHSAEGNLTRDSHDGRVFPSKTRTIEWPNVFGQEHILKMRNCISLKIFRRCAQSLQSGIFDIRTNASFRVSYSSNLVDASLLDKKGGESAWSPFGQRYDRDKYFLLGELISAMIYILIVTHIFASEFEFGSRILNLLSLSRFVIMSNIKYK